MLGLNFKTIRSFIGKRFNENQQMRIVVFLSGLFWRLRKYFLGVEREKDLKFFLKFFTPMKRVKKSIKKK